MKKLSVVVIIGLLLTLSGCETMKGLGQDIQKAGEISCLTGLSTKFESLVSDFSPPPSQFHFVDDETTVGIQLV